MASLPKIGILGGGQLGRMLALAAHPLGLDLSCYDPDPQACARAVTRVETGRFEDAAALERFADSVDRLSYEFENIPLAALESLAAARRLQPSLEALRISQDRLIEKRFLRGLGIPTVEFAAIESRKELQEAAFRLGFPSLLKTRRMGYDGKGQLKIDSKNQLEAAWEQLGASGSLLLEAWVPFDCECSCIGVRGAGGETVFYPLIQNRHESGILRQSLCPGTRLRSEWQTQAQDYLRLIFEAWGYVGVLTVEFFGVGERLIANEIAPRVHNSGHFSIEGAATSQFENHLRAVAGLPLGSTALRGFCAMRNFIGELPPPEAWLRRADAHYHDYGKTPKPGRKLGHGTCIAESADALQEKLATLELSRN